MPILATPVTASGGYYATVGDLESWRGPAEAAIFSNVDGGKTIDTARATLALEHADAELDQAIRQRGYASPLPTTSVHFRIFKHAAAKLALHWLADSGRSVRDTDTSGKINLESWREAVWREINKPLLHGLHCPRNTTAPQQPIAIDDTTAPRTIV